MSNFNLDSQWLVDVIVVLEYFTVSHIYLVNFSAVDSAKLLQDTAHCLLLVAHAKCI